MGYEPHFVGLMPMFQTCCLYLPENSARGKQIFSTMKTLRFL